MTQAARPFVAALLEGGGAKGAYQVGVLEGLQEAGLAPDWVLGISSGALNAVAYAANPPASRSAAYDRLWQRLADPYDVTEAFGAAMPPFFRQAMKTATSMTALAGKPHFFTPTPVPFLFKPDGATGSDAFYSNKPLYATIDAVGDPRTVRTAPRMSVGATDVRRGTLRWFDSAHETVTPDHVVASGAMPPGAPGVKIAGEMYWEGGLVGCNPLDPVVDAALDGEFPDGLVVVFVDLWGQDGWLPRNLPFSLIRRDQIHFAGRADAALREVRLRLRMAALEGNRAAERVTILHVQNGRTGDLLWLDPVDFGPGTLRKRRAAGRADLHGALHAVDWESETGAGGSMGRVHRVLEGRLVDASEPFVPVAGKIPVEES